ncbi:aldehyde dehydrogenase family protein [Extibacter muris]|uniref:aldehyde dehydrogenase family protein n=1 Tax=Extibacter muris TaxID=1796622 RepID=UPI001D07ED2A|nr:aldehyde dehydrogenase family protein [Extibacter muris]MCB6201583.1 aldehyde dehydrogenase EutE [Extibacter muris]MCQ4662909.1 aldehyde dehydrogenase EutE [Extibacter muris]MCQ4694207.1 aldehyde dehydrogenase EutE [Extibacter muris]
MEISTSQISRYILDLQNELKGDNPAPAHMAAGGHGIFKDAECAIMAASKAQKRLMEYSLKDRGRFIEAMRDAARENARRLAETAHEETGYGHVEDKVAKNLLAADKTPGIEDLNTMAASGDNGLMLTEMAPYGVIGAITPSTNPTATVINNGIGMIAGGNAVVFNPHPGAKKSSLLAVRIMNEAIVAAGGPDNLLCAPEEPTLDTSSVIMSHPLVKLLVVTGGEAVVRTAMKTGKKCIAAGPGNPPVVVDSTADIKKAAADIVKGACYENCILCIAEKEILVESCVADVLIREMVKEGAYLADEKELSAIVEKVMITAKDGSYAPNKRYVGRDASYILKEAGIRTDREAKIIIAEVPFEHPLVMTEMLMPVIPVTRVATVEEAIEKAVIAENGCHHTAMMHSENVNNLTKMARAADTTIFVKNAPSYAGLGIDGEGYTTLTIATPTGEGLTSAKNFTRSRRCTLHGSFRIV